MTITDVWNEAYNIYVETEDRLEVREFLKEELGHDDRLAAMIPDIESDVVETYNI